jgi:hypothetical protein
MKKLLVIVALFSLFVAGCGGGSHNGSNGGNTDPVSSNKLVIAASTSIPSGSRAMKVQSSKTLFAPIGGSSDKFICTSNSGISDVTGGTVYFNEVYVISMKVDGVEMVDQVDGNNFIWRCVETPAGPCDIPLGQGRNIETYNLNIAGFNPEHIPGRYRFEASFHDPAGVLPDQSQIITAIYYRTARFYITVNPDNYGDVDYFNSLKLTQNGPVYDPNHATADIWIDGSGKFQSRQGMALLGDISIMPTTVQSGDFKAGGFGYNALNTYLLRVDGGLIVFSVLTFGTGQNGEYQVDIFYEYEPTGAPFIQFQ